MARIKFGGIVSDISGSVGGSTFQRSNYGVSLRNKPTGILKRSPSQTTIRQLLSELHAAWRALTPGERLMWQQFISFSSPTIRRDSGILLTGHDLFIKYNMFRRMNGFAMMTVPVFASMPQTTYEPQVNLAAAFLMLSFPDIIDHDSYWFVAKVSSPRLPSRSFSNKGLRFMKITPSTNSEWDITALYVAAFGAAPLEDDYVHISIQFFSVVAPVFLAPQKKIWQVTQTV
jgi:hypothetical protein